MQKSKSPGFQPPPPSRIQDPRPPDSQPVFESTQRSPGLQPPPLSELRTLLRPKPRKAGPQPGLLGSPPQPRSGRTHPARVTSTPAKPQAVTPPPSSAALPAPPRTRQSADLQPPHLVSGPHSRAHLGARRSGGDRAVLTRGPPRVQPRLPDQNAPGSLGAGRAARSVAGRGAACRAPGRAVTQPGPAPGARVRRRTRNRDLRAAST
ncbi:uncharacterized protein LOC131397390 [Diceros bicornis minor]|uniref:uncharacterized protein LOC131397390 n=1 Tax=Diceros bicornis minor TaxID=77932 RepID=UPI0026EE92CE|nr:uncharacterized protein LOC131397390 [Diceros bicornis minor]